MYTKLVTSSFIHAISRIKIRLFLLLIIVGGQLTSQAQLRYNFERINTESGLPTNAIKGLQFDEKTRFLWVATESGIVRYNGHGFQSFGDNNATAALNGRIVFFEKTINGKLFGKLMDERVFSINENKVVIEEKSKKLSSEADYLSYKYNLTNISRDKINMGIETADYFVNNKIYTKIGFNLYQFTPSQLQIVTALPNDESGFIINDQLFFLKKDGVVFETNSKNGKTTLIKIADFGKTLSYDVKNAFTQIKVFQNNPKEPAYILANNKLFKIEYKNSQLQLNLITDQCPTNEFVKYIQIDKLTSTIYIGTDNRGLLVGRPKYFKRVIPENSIEGISTSAYSQLQLSNGNIQINTGQIFGNSSLPAAKAFYRASEPGAFVSSDSILYMTNSDGIVEFDLKKNKIVGIDNKISFNRNSFIEINNKVYSFNESGIALKSSSWDYLLRFKDMPFNFIVYSLHKINESEILAATTDGLYKYNLKLNTFKLFYRDKDHSNFRAIYNLNGYYLIGTYGSGVYMYYKDSIKKVPLDQNKYLNYSHCFIQDKKGNVWASTNKGLFMSPVQSLIDFWHKGPGNIKFKYFGKADGIDELELNGGCNPCAIKMKNGNLSFPGIDGLIQFNPDSISEVILQPRVYLDKLLVDGNIVSINSLKYELSSKVKNVEIQLGISGMLSQENIMLEYKLDNEPWVRVNVKNSIIKYSNPGFGAHTISIRLRNTINSKWEQVEYPFTISYPWTLNPYMYVVYLLLLVGLVFVYIRFKTIIYQRREKLLQTEVNAKTASLNKLNETLTKRNQAKDHVIAIMNHDILTPLKYLHITAKNIADTSKEENVKSSIKQIAKTSKELEYLTSNMLNWVKFESVESFPQKQEVDLHALVKDLIEFVEPFKLNDHLTIFNSIPVDLMIQNWPDSLRVLLYNLIVNGINNTPKGEIRVSYTTTNKGYSILVTDTGVGMNASMIQHLLKGKSKDEVEQIPKYKKGNGVGFQIIRNIIHHMNAHIEINSVEHKGTIVSISFMD
jgi:signal transduction histidine kinase